MSCFVCSTPISQAKVPHPAPGSKQTLLTGSLVAIGSLGNDAPIIYPLHFDVGKGGDGPGISFDSWVGQGECQSWLEAW